MVLARSLSFSLSLVVVQEPDGQKTNNGIQYRLQLLYANGKYRSMAWWTAFKAAKTIGGLRVVAVL